MSISKTVLPDFRSITSQSETISGVDKILGMTAFKKS